MLILHSLWGQLLGFQGFNIPFIDRGEIPIATSYTSMTRAPMFV